MGGLPGVPIMPARAGDGCKFCPVGALPAVAETLVEGLGEGAMPTGWLKVPLMCTGLGACPAGEARGGRICCDAGDHAGCPGGGPAGLVTLRCG